MDSEINSELMRIRLPLYVEIPKKTKKNERFYLNQNKFRNCHHFTMNKAKHLYKGIIASKSLPERTLEGKLVFTYILYPKSKRRMDLTNSLSAIQKFADDALVELGVIPDDDYKTVAKVEYEFGGIDKEDPRAELLVRPYNKQEVKQSNCHVE